MSNRSSAVLLIDVGWMDYSLQGPDLLAPCVIYTEGSKYKMAGMACCLGAKHQTMSSLCQHLRGSGEPRPRFGDCC